MPYELEVLPEFRNRLLRGLSALAWLLLLIGISWMGYRVSPADSAGRPLLLTPRLAQIAAYRHEVLAWSGGLKAVDTGLEQILASPDSDLFTQDGRLNHLQGDLLGLKAEMEATQIPSGLQSLQDAVRMSVDAYLLAAAHTATWLGAPTDLNHARAVDALRQASQSRERISENPWVRP